MSLFDFTSKNSTDTDRQISDECRNLQWATTRGELGAKIALLVLRHSPADIQQMKRNFGKKVQDLSPEYRDSLTRKINEHLLGTYQAVRLLNQQGAFGAMQEPVTPLQKSYWKMVTGQRTSNDANPRIRFLNYLIAAFCMFVLNKPGHAVGTPFPGGDTVKFIDGVYYCPVREKTGDVDSAICPALQTPVIGYLKTLVNATPHQKQEFIRNCHDFHNFNG